MSDNLRRVRSLLKTRVIQRVHIETPAQFLTALRPSSRRWLPPSSYRTPWIFRGIGSAQLDLTPSAWRDDIRENGHYRAVDENEDWDSADQVLEGYRSNAPEIPLKREFVRLAIVQKKFEYLSTRGFVDVADSLGLAWPGGPITNHLSFDLLEPRQIHPASCLARHHGMPSRLLDWTRNPLIAAFFAADAGKTTSGERIAVWALNSVALSDPGEKHFEFHGECKMVSPPRSEIGYLHAQEALFTYIEAADLMFACTGQWPTIEDAVPPGMLRQLTMPVSKIAELKRLLAAEGISRAKLMPTYDNVALAVQEHWST